jgi:hypothetical protein
VVSSSIKLIGEYRGGTKKQLSRTDSFQYYLAALY